VTASFDLEQLGQVFPMDSVEMRGLVDFRLKANGLYDGWLERIAGRSLIMKGRSLPAFELVLDIRDGELKYHHLPQAMSNVNFHLKAANRSGIADSTSIHITKLTANLGDNPISGYIDVRGLADPYFNSQLKAHMDLADISRFFPMGDLSLKGLFDMDVRIKGKLSDSLKTFPLVDARINLVDGYIKSAAYPVAMERAHLVLEAVNTTGRFSDTRLDIDTLTYNVDGEPFFIRGQIADLENINYDLAIKGALDLQKLSRILHIDAVGMAGKVDVDFFTSGNYSDLKANRYHRLPTAGNIRIRNAALKVQSLDHAFQINDGHLFFSNEKIFLDTLHGSIGESRFNLTGHLYNYLAYVLHNDEAIRGDLNLESNYFNLNELLQSDKITRNDTSHHHLEVIPLPANVDFRFDCDIANLIYKKVTVTDLRGEILVHDGVLAMKEIDFQALGAEFQLTGDYDIRDTDHPRFDLGVKVQDLDINKAHDAFVTVQAVAPAAEHTYGVFSVDYNLKGELLPNMYPVVGSVSGGGTVRIREAKINGMKILHHISGITKKEELMNPQLKDIVMETTVERGTLYVKPFSMKLGGFDTDIEGTHELSGSMNYVLKIALPPFDIVKIPLHINGTYEKPKVRLGKGQDAGPRTISSAVR
jgi:uncharacterized protein YhdP